MIEVKYPERETKTCKITWENNWITAIGGLSEDQFLVFDQEDERWFNRAVRNEQFEMVLLINYREKQILKIWSKSPFTYTEEYTETDFSDPAVIAEIDRKWQEILAEAPAHLSMIDAIIEALEKDLVSDGSKDEG